MLYNVYDILMWSDTKAEECGQFGSKMSNLKVEEGVRCVGASCTRPI